MAGELIPVGVFGAAHGVRGDIRLKALTQDPLAVADYGPVQAEDGRVFALTVLRPLKQDMVVVRVAGVADREAAAALTHLRLFVPRDRLPPPEEDAFYASDLVGLMVEDLTGQALGRVRAVLDFGAGDLLEIERPEGGSTALLPFTKAFVPRVEAAEGRIVADPPGGLFDEEARGSLPGDPEAHPEDRPPPRKGRTKPSAPPEAPASSSPAGAGAERRPGRGKGGRW